MPSELVRVLVTAIGGAGHGDQILKALRLASGDGYFIVGTDMSQNCPQFEEVDYGITVPRADDPSYIDIVINICKKFDIQAVFHGCEAELRIFSEHRDKFTDNNIFLPINPRNVINLCLDKQQTENFLEAHGFPFIKSFVIKGLEEIEKINCLPVLVKPKSNSGGSRDSFVAQTPTQLRNLLAYLSETSVLENILIQEYVGTPEDEYTVGVLHDMDGNFINSISVRRDLTHQLCVRHCVPNISTNQELGQYLVVSSGVSQGYVDYVPLVNSQCEAIAAKLGVHGPINFQCRLVDNKVRVFEINPRFSGTTSIRALAGFNEPDILIRKHILGESVTVRFRYTNGFVSRSLTENFSPKKAIHHWRSVVGDNL